MVTTTETVLTKEGKTKLEEELHHLETVRRAEVSERIKEAKSFGDLSENSEYDDAKNEQGWIESRIAELRHVLDIAQVVETPKRVTQVAVGTHVSLKVKGSGKLLEYDIVGSAEADTAKQAISNESPIGSALLGHKKGDVVAVDSPRGEMQLEITTIAPRK
jgi:transcription elongation factor GreA